MKPKSRFLRILEWCENHLWFRFGNFLFFHEPREMTADNKRDGEMPLSKVPDDIQREAMESMKRRREGRER